jgi:hypothetical protein
MAGLDVFQCVLGLCERLPCMQVLSFEYLTHPLQAGSGGESVKARDVRNGTDDSDGGQARPSARGGSSVAHKQRSNHESACSVQAVARPESLQCAVCHSDVTTRALA